MTRNIDTGPGPWMRLFAATILSSTLLAASIAQAATQVYLSGPRNAGPVIPDADGRFEFRNVPLRENSVDTFTVTAVDDAGNRYSRDVSITQVSLDQIVVSKVTAERLSAEQVEQLVQDGVIELDDPENYNVSTFDIVLTIAQKPVSVKVPVVMPKEFEPQGYERIQLPMDSGGGAPKPRPVEMVVFEEIVPGPPGQPPISIPGVLVIEGRIRSLKEFFSVRLLLMNTSGIFTLRDVTATIAFPDGGLSNVLPADGIISFGEILPGDGDQPGQKEKEFIVRGDEIGVRDVRVEYGGVLAGPGIADDEPIAFSGSAVTDVEVKGPPTFDVQVSHPDAVVAQVPYDLTVEITNTGDIPALYASLELDLGADGELVRCDLDPGGLPVCEPVEGSDVRTLGHLLPGETVTQVFTVLPSRTGDITSCMAAADQNIGLRVVVGTIGCLVGELPPGRIPADGSPAVSVLPSPNTDGVHTDSPVVGFFSEAMNEATITAGVGGTFRVFDGSGTRVPGRLRFETINDRTVAIWQVDDGVTYRLKPDTEYTVQVTTGVADLDGDTLKAEWVSTFRTTGTGLADLTPPVLALSIKPPVDPNYVLPGQIIRVDAYATDQGSGIARVEARLKDLNEPGARFRLVDQKTVFDGDLPPFIFSIDSAKLAMGHTYQLLCTAFDGNGNLRDSTLSFVVAPTADPPAVTLPAGPADPVLHGISVDLTPVSVTGGGRRVAFFLDGAASPFKTVSVAPYQASLNTVNLPLGDHTVRAVVSDPLGQTGEDTLSFTLIENRNMPVVGFAGAQDGAQVIAGSEFLVRGTAEDPVGIVAMAYYLDDPGGTPLYQGTAPILLDTTGLSVGDHAIYVSATNALGISNDIDDPASVLLFSVVEPPPGAPPGAPVTTAVSPPEDGTVTVSGTSEPGARVDVTNVATGQVVSVQAAADGTFTAQIDARAGDGLQVVAYDFSRSQDPSEAATVVVSEPPALERIEVSPSSLAFDTAQAFGDIVVTGRYSDGSSRDLTDRAAFSSGDPAVAAVSAAGRVVAIGHGSTAVTVAVAGQSVVVPVTSTIVVLTHITVSPSTVDLVAVGQTEQLAVTGHYSDGSSQPLSAGNAFSVGDRAVATVTGGGLVAAAGPGGTTVTVSTAGAAPVTVPVTVDTSLDPAPLVSLLNPADGSTVERGDVVTVTVRARDDLGGVVRVFLEVSGETAFSEFKQIAPAALDTTQTFSFPVSTAAAVGGAVTVSAWAEDTSGHVSPTAVATLGVTDTTPPAVAIGSPAQGAPFNFGDTVVVTVDAADAVGVTAIRYETSGALVLSGTRTISPAATTAQAEFSFDVPFGAASPDVRIRAFAVDAEGNEGAAVPVDIVLTDADITPPETVATAVTDPGTGSTATITYRVTAGLADLDHVELYFRRNGIGTFNRYTDGANGNPEGLFHPAGDTGTILFDATRMGGDGAFEFYTVGVDLAGNREPPPSDGTGGVLPDRFASFDAGIVWTVIDASTTIGPDDTSYDDANLRISGAGVVVTMDGRHTFRNVEILDGAVLTHPAADLVTAYALDIEVWTLSIDATSSIRANALGFLGGYQGGSSECAGRTVGNAGGAAFRAGGSHGGPGGSHSGSAPNPVYGSLTAPTAPGSGGGCFDSARPGGNGGGAVRIQAVNVAADGPITADGAPGAGGYAGSGSGGSIYVTTASLSGQGLIAADGGGYQVGGGGGRVAIHYIDMGTKDAGSIRALGGQGSSADGGNGTVFLKGLLEANGTLVVDGQGASTGFSTLPIPPGYVFDNIVIRNDARVVADDPLVVNGTLQVLTGSVLTHSVGSETGLRIEAARVEVDATSTIDVSEKGYRGGYRDGNAQCAGVALGGLAGAGLRAGGSYGGYGGLHDGSASSNAAYGHPAEPVYLGSGGGCYDSARPGGNGGGRVEIAATEAVVVDGSIRADGGPGGGGYAGSGSGGSIRIETSLLRGAGAVSADGGGYQVGGGGGRVAVVYDYFGDPGDDLGGGRDITAFGGHGSSKWGSAGTVLLRRSDQPYGDLYVDDGMADATANVYTPLTLVGFGEVVAVTDDTLVTDGLVRFAPNGLVGLEITPNTVQGETYFVTSNTQDTITVDTAGKPSLTAVAAAGDTYAGIYRFDNVSLRGGGFLVLGDRLVVSDRLLIDEYGQLTHYDATGDHTSRLDLTAGTLEVAATGAIDVDGRGYLGGYGPVDARAYLTASTGSGCAGRTVGNADGAAFRAGGSHGGLGGSHAGSVPNPVYGSPTDPAALGSGGGCYDSARPGGSGGGWVTVVAGDVVVDGVVSANGGSGGGSYAGSGSGGTVDITASTLTGTGVIRADGGGYQVGGGGGRIAVRYDVLGLDPANIQAFGGSGSYASGADGTVYLEP